VRLDAVISAGRETSMKLDRIALAVSTWLLLGLLVAGCSGLSSEPESLETSAMKPNEGVVVVRFLTSKVHADDMAHPQNNPDISYSVDVGSMKSHLFKLSGQKGSLKIDAKQGPVLFARKLDAGDYYFNTIQAAGGSADMAVKFSVRPGRVTYIGDLHVTIIESKGLLFSTSTKCEFAVSTDVPAMTEQLKAHFHSIPQVDTVPMVLENVSL
jgi:hypothetical protein